MDAKERLTRIAEKLKAAKAKDVWPFGAEEHCFRLEPVLAESEVAGFEARWNVQLPREYREFICQLGNGGAGPAYGLFPLSEAISFRGKYPPGDFLCTPFPFETAYNPYEDAKLSEYWEKPKKGQISQEDYEARKLKEIAGTLALCHEGCGYMHLLVISGMARGKMWLDATVSDGGYVPLDVGFLDWYEKWLDNALAGGDGVWWTEE